MVLVWYKNFGAKVGIFNCIFIFFYKKTKKCFVFFIKVYTAKVIARRLDAVVQNGVQGLGLVITFF